MRSKNRYLLGVKLRDGSVYEFSVPKMPAHWCSWVMQQVPYGTPFQGCSFYREKIAA